MSLINIIKQAAVDAVHASNPVQLLFGKVTNDVPLEISIGGKYTLTEEFLYVTDSLARHDRIVHLEYDTTKVRDVGNKEKHKNRLEDNRLAVGLETREHIYSKLTFDDILKIDDEVLLIKMQGGGQYLVVDRVRGASKIWQYQHRH